MSTPAERVTAFLALWIPSGRHDLITEMLDGETKQWHQLLATDLVAVLYELGDHADRITATTMDGDTFEVPIDEADGTWP